MIGGVTVYDLTSSLLDLMLERWLCDGWLRNGSAPEDTLDSERVTVVRLNRRRSDMLSYWVGLLLFSSRGLLLTEME